MGNILKTRGYDSTNDSINQSPGLTKPRPVIRRKQVVFYNTQAGRGMDKLDILTRPLLSH